MISLIYEILKNGTNEPIYKIEIIGRKAGQGGINWEIGTDIYTLLYIKQITNKDLLYTTGNSSQYSVMTYMGKESLPSEPPGQPLGKESKDWIYIYAKLIHFDVQQKLTTL